MASRYLLYYWPIPFRGNFIRVLLAYAGEALEDGEITRLVELKNQDPSEQDQPFMAPPLLWDRQRSKWLSQSPAIMLYLSHEHGLMPQDGLDTARAMKVFSDASDVLADMTHNNGGKMWEQEEWNRFLDSRFLRWLQIFEQQALNWGLTEEEGWYLGGDEASLADITVFALWATMERCLPELSPRLREHAPSVMALTDRIGAHPGVAAMVEAQAAQRGVTWCGGQIEASLRRVLAEYC